MLSKWLNRKSVPVKEGTQKTVRMEKRQFVKVFQLELRNMDKTPLYDLKHQLTIGSEIGNIIIADPSLSPRHATFILQQDVVSVTDHGSVSGTFINGSKIPAGKFIILEETDVISIGDLELHLKVGTESKLVEEIPDLPVEDIPEIPKVERVIQKIPKNDPRPIEVERKKKKKVQEDSHLSANSLVRVMAVVCDILLSYSLLTIFLPFDEFREFLKLAPEFISSFINVDWMSIGDALTKDNGFIGEMIQDALTFAETTLSFGPLIIIFILNRLITTLLFGVSLSEFLLGMRAKEIGLWARFGGGVRVLIGVITGPFLIFDLPSIISRRTFKEVITFTNTQAPSKFLTIIGIILVLPLFIALGLVSPLFQGLEAPSAIVVSDKIDQRIKVKIQGAENPAPSIKANEVSKTLGVNLTYNPQELLIIPGLEFRGIKSKLNLRSGLFFSQRDIKRTVELEVFKTFDFKQLIALGMRGNLFLYDKYPQLYSFVYEADEKSSAFKTSNDVKTQNAFANEFIQFTKTAFGLDFSSAQEVMESETLLIKGLIDYKSSFLRLLEYKNFDQIGFIKIGNIVFMKIEYKKEKSFDLIIPLVKGEGRIFKINYDKNENLEFSASKFYKYNLENSDWLMDKTPVDVDGFTSLEVFDLLNAKDLKTRLQSSDLAQSLYGYYFETSSDVLKRGEPVELNTWLTQVKSIVLLFETISQDHAEEAPIQKLIENFHDLEDAIENKNFEYFGIPSSATI